MLEGEIQATPHYFVGEVASAATILGTVAGYLPVIATIFAIIWYIILIYESNTFRRLTRARKRIEKDALAARIKVLDTAKDAAARLADLN